MSGGHPLLELIAGWGDVPWLEHAACVHREGFDIDLFFTTAGSSIRPDVRAVCVSCPVRRSCLAHAFDHQINQGYFGGLSSNARRALGRTRAMACIAAD